MRKLLLNLAFTTALAQGGVCLAQSQNLETWTGQGIRYNSHKEEPQAYQLKVEIRTLGKGQRTSKVTVTPNSGKIKVLDCKQQDSEKGWSLDCSYGNGGGYCFENGMCQTYTSDEAGRSFATTISFDGKESMRLLRTELLNGQAVGFFQENLKKQ